MRLVQVTIPTGKREAVLAVLDEEGIDYTVTEETSDREYAGVATFPLPTPAVEPVLESLRTAGVDREAYTVVLDAETVVSDRFDALVERYAEEEGDDRIAREELVARADELTPAPVSFVVLTVASAVVATAGLLLDSPAVVVGSMVIAPLIGPAMATSVGTVVDDRELFARGVRLQAAGGILAIGSAAVFAALVHELGVVPMDAAEVFAIGEVRERLAPDVLSLAVALAAGAAGALSLSTGVSAALVGVMIAAALVPPTAVVGIGIAWGEPEAVVGSAVLVLVNFLSVNLAALAVLWRTGYRPVEWFRRAVTERTVRRRAAGLLVAVLVVSTFLVGVSYATTRTAAFEDRVHDAAADELASIEETDLLGVEVTYTGGLSPGRPSRLLLRQPERVTVTVAHTPGVDPPPLAAEIAARVGPIAARTLDAAEPPAVEVRLVTVERA